MIRYISIAQLKSVSDAFFLILSVSIYIGFQAAEQTSVSLIHLLHQTLYPQPQFHRGYRSKMMRRQINFLKWRVYVQNDMSNNLLL